MTSHVVAAAQIDTRSERYRRAERALWNHYGLDPIERFVELDDPHVRLRVLELGSGEPVLFIPGTPGTGPYWGALVRELKGFRCLLLDRPGWGLSSPIDYSKHEYTSVVAEVICGVLDALAIDRAHLVGHSIGDVWALRTALAHPDRIGRVVLIGGGPVVPEIPAPPFIKVLASPLGAIMVRLPQKADRVRSLLRQAGHGASLDAGRIPDEFVEWRVAFHRNTNSMRNERNMVRSLVSRSGWRPGLTLDDAELGAVRQPVLWVYGTADSVGSVETWRRAVSQLAQAELRVVDEAGHLPWLDDPALVGGSLRSFLAG
jgi:pimeloyl-ACP methyl ester carboxylesterase